METRDKEGKRAGRGPRFNAIDIAVILAVLAIIVSVALRFLPLNRIAEKKAGYTALITVKGCDGEALASAGLAAGCELRFADGTPAGQVVSVRSEPSVFPGDGSLRYPESSIADLTLTLSCELLVSEAGTFAANGTAVSAGAPLELYGKTFVISGDLLSLTPQN